MPEYAAYAFELDGRPVRAIVATPFEHLPPAELYWTVQVGGCDVGTDVPFDRDRAPEDVLRDLKDWYTRVDGPTSLELCWRSARGAAQRLVTWAMPECPGMVKRPIAINGVMWTVCEHPGGTRLNESRSLIFYGPGLVRRTRRYPPNWRELSDEQLFELSWSC